MVEITHKEILSDKLKRKYEFCIPQEILDQKIEKKIFDIQKDFITPGFRKGKVPIDMVKMHKYDEAVNATIHNEVLNTSEDFLKKNNFEPVSKPNITNVDYDKSIKYVIEFELTPQVPEINLDELNVQKENVDLTDEDYNENIKNICETAFTLKDTDSAHKTQKGNMVYIDFNGTINDTPFQGGNSKDFALEIGSGSVLLEIEDGIVGMRKGEIKDITAVFPDDYQIKDLASKTAVFKVKVNKIMLKEPVSDEGGIVKYFKCKDYDDFKNRSNRSLQEKCEVMIRLLAKKEIFGYFDSTFTFDVPESMVEAEAKKISNSTKNQEEIKLEATKRVKLGFILMKIAKEKSIVVTEQDISDTIYRKSRGDVKNLQYIVDLYKKNPDTAIALKGEILEEKVTEFIVNLIKPKEGISLKTLEELFNNIEG